MGFLNTLGQLLTRDLTGRSWSREATHPYFENLVYFGFKDEQKCYWESELLLPNGQGRIGVTMQGTKNGPTEAEVAFCRRTLSDLDGLFAKCRKAFEATYEPWVKAPMPADWRSVMTLDGFWIPRDGDESNDWEVCYFVEPAQHYFTAVFRNGRVERVDVDG